jgi:hypothetical protein
VFLILCTGTICGINENNDCRVLIDVSSFSTFKNGRTVYEFMVRCCLGNLCMFDVVVCFRDPL